MGLPRQATTPLDYRVRPGRLGDIPAIQATARSSWTAAYGPTMAPEVLASYLDRGNGPLVVLLVAFKSFAR